MVVDTAVVIVGFVVVIASGDVVVDIVIGRSQIFGSIPR